MYFDRNIDLSEKIRMAKKSEGNYLSSALNEEIYFRDFKFWLLVYFLIVLNCEKFEQHRTNLILVIL